MEPKFQTSFIPKKSIIEASKSRFSTSKSGNNIFSIAATILFVLTLGACGGLFFYKNSLTSQIAKADKDLNDARAAFQIDTIQNLMDANARIIGIKTLLERHFVVSKLLTLLQSFTIKTVRFDDFLYSNKTNTPTVYMNAQGQSYNALATQSDIFSKNQSIQYQNFSDFSLDNNGNVKVKISITLDPGLVSYKKAIESLTPNQ